MNIHQLPILNNEAVFDDSICDLFNKLENTYTFQKFGKKGHSQKGIDIFSGEKDCAIQCKKKDISRNAVLVKRELLNDIEKDISKVVEKKLKIKIDRLIFTSTFKDDPEISEFCEVQRGLHKCEFEIIYWGWDTISSRFLDHEELLHKYWPNFVVEIKGSERDLSRNLELKRRIKNDFYSWFLKRETDYELLIRDIEDKQYPHSNEANQFGVFPSFKVWNMEFFHEGIIVGISLIYIQVFPDNSWDYVNYNEEISGEKVKVYKLGRILFSDIIDYDIDGDDCTPYPIMFCEFSHRGSPFVSVFCRNVDRIWETYEENSRRT